MGQPRAGSRRKQPIVLSSDDEDDHVPQRPQRPTRQNSLKSGNTAANGLVAVKKPSSQPLLSPSPQNDSDSPEQSQKSRPGKAVQTTSNNTKARTRTIYSFFNAATQRQQSKRSASPEKPGAADVKEEDDLISDGSIAEDIVPSQGSNNESRLALALRKRSRAEFEEETNGKASGLPSGSQKFRKISDGGRGLTNRTASSHATVEDLRPWTERYGPVNTEELAVHKKKVADVRNWLTDVFTNNGRKRLLILKGAAGTGKTMTLRLLSEELGIEVNEWKNPTGADMSTEGYVSASAQFEEFIGRTGKFRALDFGTAEKLDESSKSQIILIEEFPHTTSRASPALQSFRATILQYLAANTSPLRNTYSSPSEPTQAVTPIIMVISETLLSNNTAAADSFTAHRMLGTEILTHPGVSLIEFNAVAPTILMKALELVVMKEARKSGRRKTPGLQVLKHLSEVGDVRSAISSLEFLCVRGDEGDGWGAKVAFTKSKRSGKDVALTKMERESLAVITQRESALGIFHAVGKVVYNKREASPATDATPIQPPSHLSQHMRPKVPEADANTLIDELGTDTQTFVAALHENYVLSCERSISGDTLDHINGCIDSLSDADLLSPDRFSVPGSSRRTFQGSSADSLRQDEISFQVSVRGILFNLPSPVDRKPVSGHTGRRVRGDPYKMFYPTSLKIWRQREEIEGLIDLWVSRAQRGQLSFSHNASTPNEPFGPGGVETWRRNAGFGGSLTPPQSGVSAKAVSADDEETINDTALPASGASARQEMMLERLPYMAIILRRRVPSSKASTLQDIQRVTAFTGIEDQSDDALEEEGSTAALNPAFVEYSLRKTGSGPDNVALGEADVSDSQLLNENGVAGLVLADDDIEDD